MEFSTLKLSHDYKAEHSDFLDASAHLYLTGCDNEIYEYWEQDFPPLGRLKHKSLANVMNNTVFKPKFSKITTSKEFKVFKAFHHQKATQNIIYEHYKSIFFGGFNKSLIITQDENFKEKFRYDSSTMTIETIIKDFKLFNEVVGKKDFQSPLFLVFHDIRNIRTSSVEKGNNEYIKLIKGDE